MSSLGKHWLRDLDCDMSFLGTHWLCDLDCDMSSLGKHWLCDLDCEMNYHGKNGLCDLDCTTTSGRDAGGQGAARAPHSMALEVDVQLELLRACSDFFSAC